MRLPYVQGCDKFKRENHEPVGSEKINGRHHTGFHPEGFGMKQAGRSRMEMPDQNGVWKPGRDQTLRECLTKPWSFRSIVGGLQKRKYQGCD
jgi:hypothetical protein